jgi:hypothetical protein
MQVLWGLPAVFAGLAVIGGAGRVPWRAAVAVVLAAGVAVGFWLAGERVQGVHEAAFIEGVLIGGLLIGVLPTLIYYVVGRGLRGHPVAAGITWLVSLVPLYLWFFLTLLASAALVACPPGSYECPV